jgi:hypothetical protein
VRHNTNGRLHWLFLSQLFMRIKGPCTHRSWKLLCRLSCIRGTQHSDIQYSWRGYVAHMASGHTPESPHARITYWTLMHTILVKLRSGPPLRVSKIWSQLSINEITSWGTYWLWETVILHADVAINARRLTTSMYVQETSIRTFKIARNSTVF